jgi:hypothetical protein
MKRLLAAVVLAGSLFAVTGAEAKAPPNGFQFCGANACVAITTDAEILAINLFYGDARLVAPPTAAPSDFYLLRWQYPNESPGSAYFIDASGVVKLGQGAPGQFSAGGYWLQPSASALAALRRLSGALEPVHAPAPLRVTVGGRPARDPASYSRLWTVGRPAIPVHPRGWIRVRITTATPTPWSDETTDVEVARRGGWLARDGTFFRVPATFAARVRARASLR